MKTLLLLALTITTSIFAKECTFSTELKYDINSKIETDKERNFLNQEKDLIWDLKEILVTNLNCKYVAHKKGLFHINLSVFRYIKKIEYFGLIFKDEDQRSVSFSIDYNNKFYQGFVYRPDNREMIDKSFKFILSKLN